MMKISLEQIKRMAAADEQRFLLSLERKVRRDFSSIVDGLPEDLLRQMLKNGISAARWFGILDPSDISSFIYIMFEVGPEFFSHPEIKAFLSDNKIPSGQKLSAMFERTRAKTWDEVSATIHEQTWFPELKDQG